MRIAWVLGTAAGLIVGMAALVFAGLMRAIENELAYGGHRP